MQKVLMVAAVLAFGACTAKENAVAGRAMKADTGMKADSSRLMADSMPKPDSVMARDTAHAMKK